MVDSQNIHEKISNLLHNLNLKPEKHLSFEELKEDSPEKKDLFDFDLKEEKDLSEIEKNNDLYFDNQELPKSASFISEDKSK